MGKVILTFYGVVRKPDPNIGTPGEALPTFNLGLHVKTIEDTDLAKETETIQKEHEDCVRGTPLERRFPSVYFYKPKPIELDFQI